MNSEYQYHSNAEFVRCVHAGICEKGYFWNGSDCVTSCRADSCNIPYSNQICTPTSETEYSCGCIQNHFWDGYACINPCDASPCEGEHSNGICTPINAKKYTCGCVDGYYWRKDLGCTDQTPSIGNICTGQNKCYNNNETGISCHKVGEDFFGQDAQYADNGRCLPKTFSIDYTFENEKIVIDHVTGLQWQRDFQTNYERSWDDAASYCNDLTYGGYSDWRLPSPHEFQTIADSNNVCPAVDTTYFMNLADYSMPWTSKIYQDGTGDSVWSIDFCINSVDGNWRYRTAPAICVRGVELPEASFTSLPAENGDIVVTDSASGLIWQKTYETNKTWQEALAYCENLEYAGYSDWRLPNRNELMSLINYDRFNPASDFPDMPEDIAFWSSTSFADHYNRSWAANFFDGRINDIPKTDNSLSVKCVRSE